MVADLDIACDNIDAQVNIFRADERVRADLAQANYIAYLEKLKAKTAPQGEGDLSDLAMEAISNKLRDWEVEQNMPLHSVATGGCGSGDSDSQLVP